MKIGFTGTQQGMTEKQQEEFVKLIQEFNPTEFHHGDCIGADKQANDFVFAIYKGKAKIVIHPPVNPAKRAWCNTWDDMRPQRDYLKRNHDLVNETDLLIATPKEANEVVRSGTWSTIRYARKQNKEVMIIAP
jgi:hypothetical protein